MFLDIINCLNLISTPKGDKDFYSLSPFILRYYLSVSNTYSNILHICDNSSFTYISITAI